MAKALSLGLSKRISNRSVFFDQSRRWRHNISNRRIRTRTYGGLAEDGGRAPPVCRSWPCAPGNRRRYRHWNPRREGFLLVPRSANCAFSNPELVSEVDRHCGATPMITGSNWRLRNSDSGQASTLSPYPDRCALPATLPYTHLPEAVGFRARFTS